MTTASTDALLGLGFRGLPERERLARAAKELEAVVVSQLFETMRKTVPDGGLIERSAAEDVFRTMLDGELARVVADRSPFGLAQKIVEEMGPHLDAAAGTPAAAPDPSIAATAPPSRSPLPTSPAVPAAPGGFAPAASGTVPPRRGWRA